MHSHDDLSRNDLIRLLRETEAQRANGATTDDEALRKSEERLRRKEAELSEAQRLAHIGSWYWDAKTDVTTGSDELLRIFGFDPATETMPNFEEQRGRCYPVEDWERINAAVRRTIETGVGYELDVRALRKETPIWITTRSEVVRGADGRAVGLRGTVQDITERKRTEEALRDSEAFLSKVMDGSLNGLYVYDLKRRTNLFINRQYTRLTGYTLDDVNAMSGPGFFALFHPEDAVRVAEHMERVSSAADGQEVEIEYRFRTADGRWIWCLSRDSVFARGADGSVTQFIGTFLDVTQRKQAELALRESEALFRELVQNANSAIIRWSSDGTLTFFNEYAQTLFGWRADEAIGRHVGILVPERESSGADLRGLAQDIVRNPQRYVNNVNENVCRDGRRVWMTWTNRAICDAQGQVTGVLAIGNDITAQKQAEEALREADRRKDEFLATLAHELRNPLAPIRNAAYVLGKLQVDNERVRWAQELIERQVTHLTRLVDDLLDVSRIVRGKATLRMGAVLLGEVVAQAVESVRPILEARHHRFEMRLPVSAVSLHADPARLTQVIVNLLDNAAKYTPQGGHISLEAEVTGGTLEIRVRDDGMGMPADLLPRVFDLFQQGERALDGSDGGLGIGLTLVRSLVEMHGGQVSASSPGPGQGATFTVRLPLAQEFAAGRPAAVTPVAEQTASANGMPVLVVEDDAAVAASMVGLLELVGYEVRTAGTGRAALQVLENFRPRVVLLDIRMPGEDGYSVARRIRQLPGGDAMLLVALTGYGHDEALRRAAEAGFDRHLAKPVEPDELLELLAETAKSAA